MPAEVLSVEVQTDLLGTRSFGAYHALAGRRFSAATDYVPIAAAGEQDLAAFVNPADSGVAVFLDIGEFGGVRRSGFRSRLRNRLDLVR